MFCCRLRHTPRLAATLLFLVLGVLRAQWAEVPPVDLGTLSPAAFADEELDLPYYLHHFHRVANRVVEEGENRGFIDISVWRRRRDNRPYNARIMENHLSFAWFYCTDRPWNPYYNHPAVRQRLEAVLEFWCDMQHEDGRFSEYGEGRWNLAATAFATKFMARTLTLLADGPEIDAALHQRVRETQRKALMATFTSDTMWQHGIRCANQYSNAWPGVLSYLANTPDPELAELFRQRLADSATGMMSPAGYFYENNGPDWNYSLGTEQSNLRMAWDYTKETPLGAVFQEKQRRFVDWLSYNVAVVPGSSGFALNHAIETRTRREFLHPSGGNMATTMVRDIPLAAAFLQTAEERQERVAQQRAALEANWPEVRDLSVGNFSAFSPYTFLHREHDAWHPADAERDAARAQLPHLARESFTHQRADSKRELQFSFVRRPDYYAIFNSGSPVSGQHRFGLSLLWHPALGAVLNSSRHGAELTWGTRPADAERPLEAAAIASEYTLDGTALEVAPGIHDRPEGDEFTATYALGEAGRKTLVFGADRIEVRVEHPGAFREQLPLLVGGDGEVVVGDGNAVLERDGYRLIVTAEAPGEVEWTLGEPGRSVGPYRLVPLSLAATDRLVYTFRFVAVE